MKILYVYPELTIKGGADKVIVDKANYLARNGYDVTILTEAQMGREPSFPIDPAVRHIDMALDFNRQYHQGFFRRAYTYLTLMRRYRRQFTTVIETMRPDIVITALGRSLDFITDLKDGSLKLGEAHCIKEHLRNLHQMEQKGFFYRLVARRMKTVTYQHVAQLDALVLLTQEDADSWKEVAHTYVIPNAVPFIPDRCSTLTSKEAIMVARYNNAKGLNYMIDAWRLVHLRHPDWRLNIYGSGELFEQVKRWIAEKELTSVIILHKPVEQIMEKYLESSLCVMSSRYEAFPLALLEAMACGVPCVAFDCPHGPHHIIRNEEDGLLVDHLDVQALADGICRLIEDGPLRRQLGSQAHRNIQRFSKDMVMEQWKRLFDQLIKDHRP